MKILIAFDFSDISDKLFHQAALLAENMSAELVLLHVAEPQSDFIAYDYDPVVPVMVNPVEIRDQTAHRLHREHKSLQQYADQLRDRSITCKALMVQGDTVDMILQQAQKMNADFIIAGSHGKGLLSQVFLGSISETLIQKSHIPVYLVPADKS